jgi:hypothetical protein
VRRADLTPRRVRINYGAYAFRRRKYLQPHTRVSTRGRISATTILRRAGLCAFKSRSAILEGVTVKNTNKIAVANAASIAEGADEAHRQHDQQNRAPPDVRLLSKAKILAITGVTFPTIWSWMRQGKFP